jgi:endonuclease YncB( thermonuclease family)
LNRLFAFVLLCLAAFPLYAETLAGRVVSITDGDTLTLLDGTNTQHKIRLAGIDAPERHQAFGSKSQSSLAALAFGQNITANCGKNDRYGREICKVLVDGQDINLEQIKAGMAWWYVAYAKEQAPQDRGLYEQAQFFAQARRLGLWGNTNPTPPWEWRRSK